MALAAVVHHMYGQIASVAVGGASDPHNHFDDAIRRSARFDITPNGGKHSGGGEDNVSMSRRLGCQYCALTLVGRVFDR